MKKSTYILNASIDYYQSCSSNCEDTNQLNRRTPFSCFKFFANHQWRAYPALDGTEPTGTANFSSPTYPIAPRAMFIDPDDCT